MVENINTALEPLKQALAASGRIPIIPEPVLARQFHGLNLHQLVQLTAAPALAVVSRELAANGSHRERFTVDGTDEQRCDVVGRQLVLDGASPLHAGDVREVCISSANGAGKAFMRDQSGVVYRLIDGQAAVDEELTELLRSSGKGRLNRGATESAATGDEGQALVQTLEEMLEASAALQARNGMAAQAIERLIAASGQADLATAVAALPLEALAATFKEILMASGQVARLADAITGRTKTVLQLVRAAVEGPDQPGNAPAMPLKQADRAELLPFPHEPF